VSHWHPPFFFFFTPKLFACVACMLMNDHWVKYRSFFLPSSPSPSLSSLPLSLPFFPPSLACLMVSCYVAQAGLEFTILLIVLGL
jgi:hypothetical protein